MTSLSSASDDPRSLQSPLLIERFLRHRADVWRQIHREQQLGTLITQMLLHATAALACYGAIMGMSHGSLWQILAAAVKLPLLFLLTLAICLPTLYLVNLLGGGHLSVSQLLALVLTAIVVTANLAIAFAPVVVFFWITARNYAFFILLNVGVLAGTGLIGLRFLVSGVRFINALDAAPRLHSDEQRDHAGASTVRSLPLPMTLVYGWLVLYSLVGTQLGWTLRPVLGDPTAPFRLFQPIESNFYVGLFEILMQFVN